ncbi:MAG: GGDEF domain-containing protein [Fibromonadaceae bacterium]|jgi:diguanylate cyclase (GGDEF)-like protein|nr:GGDEF domain-containing protein [Fibromonadaceae bacterium]
MSLKKIIFFSILALVIVMTSVLSVFHFSLSKNRLTRIYAEKTLGIAKTYAEVLNGDSIELDFKRREKNALYDSWKHIADSVLAKNELKYFYVMNLNHSDSIEYYISAKDIEGQINFLDKDDAQEFHPEEIEKLRKGLKTKGSSVTNTPKYGLIISGYASVKNSNGKAVAFVGADKEVAEMNKELSRVSLVSLAASFLFMAVMFLTTMLVVRKVFLRPLTKLIEAADNFNLLNISFEEMDYINIKEYDSLIDSFRKMEKKINSALKKSFIDDLTKLHNRYFFMLSMENILKPSAQVKKIAFFIIDLDYFKQVNDTYGHDKGDFVLRSTGAVLRDLFGNLPGVVARLGGDEFAICLENVDRQTIVSKCEFFKKQLSKIKCSEEKDSTSASIGVAMTSFSTDAPAYTDIFSAADAALYKVKARGRNGYEIVEI